MRQCLRLWAAALCWTVLSSAHATETIRFAVQKTGTTAWELEVIKTHELDKQADLKIDTRELASPEAGKIALIGGAADVIVSDWLWVSRERSGGATLFFTPIRVLLGRSWFLETRRSERLPICAATKLPCRRPDR